MKKSMFRSFWVLAFFAFCQYASASELSEVKDVSMVQLLVNPEKFNGQEVRLIGFLHLEFEGNGIYFHKEDYKNNIFMNGIAVDLSDSQIALWKKFNNCYVLIEGRFNSVDKGHMGSWSGSMQNIKRVKNWTIRRE